MLELTQAALDFGGSNAWTGVSTSRTLMLAELTALLDATTADASPADYRRAVVEENVLLKPSADARAKTWSYLRDRFALDPAVPVFRVLRLLWGRDEPGQPCMALLVAALRDPVLRGTLPAVIATEPDHAMSWRNFSPIIAASTPETRSPKSLKAAGERAISSFRQSGHLSRRLPSARQRILPTPGSSTLALLIATLEGAGGMALFETDWVRLLDTPPEALLAEARTASSRGWLELRHAGDVLEITFHGLLATAGMNP